ncbi:MAG: hypothetical protein ABIC40_00785, partial [bacterium]
YDHFFNKVLDLGEYDAIGILNFAREVRNTIHNNGVYWKPEKQQDLIFNRHGKTFIFKHGNRVKFDWYDMLDLSDDLRDLLRKTVGHKKLREYDEEILDPFLNISIEDKVKEAANPLQPEGTGRGIFSSPGEADEFIRKERDSWDH